MAVMIPNTFAAVADDETIKPVHEKYVITKYQSTLFPSHPEPILIELVNLNQTKINPENPRIFKVIKTDFTLTSSGKMSSAESNILSSNMQILDPMTNLELDEIILPNLTKFYVTTNIIETETATYSGKIYLLSESQSIPIDIEIKIVHNFSEIIFFNVFGLGVASLVFLWCRNDKHDFLGDYEFNPGDNHPVLIVVISVVSIPATLLISTIFVGVPIIDNVIAFGTGSIIVAKLIKRKESVSTDEKINIKIQVDKILEDDIAKESHLVEQLNKNETFQGWYLDHENKVSRVTKKPKA